MKITTFAALTVKRMIKIYSMKTCPYCEFLYEQVKDDSRFEIVDIASHVRYMHEFLSLRDNRPEFDHSKAIGDIGIPVFLLEDGTITLKPEDVGLVEYQPGGPVCSIDGKGC